MDPLFILALAILGCVTGFAAGLLGIGGGMLLVPFLTFLLTWQGLPIELTVHAAIATSMASILFTSVSSVRAHNKKGAVRWDLVAALTPGIVVGGLVSGGAIFSFLKTGWLALFFALFVGYSAYQMLRDKKPKPSRQMPGKAGTVAAGGTIGFLSGLVGAGGGFISVPFLLWCNVPLHQAVGTSAALGFPIALANTIGYIWSGWNKEGLPFEMVGYIYWPALIILAICSVILAPVGARAAHNLPVKTLKRIFAFLLFGLAAYMAYKAYYSFFG
ncbi:sulfite exporter TauE/SafE family protein [Zwartia vadi]|uniref:sulfite exporter TauE/SafE family protein n=1 Tax=Zwartia vadi TaxID=3058168 RepID=UPI0025B5FAED|nr:sulfite exporter TauE/SafE family protein [Zwartia vadi]MDN3987344.1 sulfite exporter TauE/SafE family protein [Zwartia vadi]